MAFLCQFVIRMNLDRQIITCIDKLDQQRECGTEPFGYLFTQQLFAICTDQFIQRFTLEFAIIDDGIITLHM